MLFSTRWAWPLSLSTLAAVECAVLHNWAWHERWTWRGRAATGWRRRLLTFHATNGALSLIGNIVCAEVLARTTTLPLSWRSAAAVALTGAVNFLAADRLVFRASADVNGPRRPIARRAARWSRPRGAVRLPGVAITMLLVCAAAAAAEPPPAVIAAWDNVVRTTEAQMASQRTRLPSFGRDAVLHGGIDIRELDAADIPGATLQRWRGAVLVPGVRLDTVLQALEHTPPRQPDVPSSRILWRDGHRLGLALRMVRRTLMTVTFDTEHEVTFERVTASAAVSRSVMTRVHEVRHAGSASERRATDDEERGFLWRLNAYWWYQETPAGVMVMMESLTLSRDTPLLLRPVAAPLVRRIAAESVRSALEGVRARFARPS